MQILAICRRRTESFTPEQFAALLDDEAEGVRSLYGQGIVRAAWTREDVLGACLLNNDNWFVSVISVDSKNVFQNTHVAMIIYNVTRRQFGAQCRFHCQRP